MMLTDRVRCITIRAKVESNVCTFTTADTNLFSKNNLSQFFDIFSVFFIPSIIFLNFLFSLVMISLMIKITETLGFILIKPSSG